MSRPRSIVPPGLGCHAEIPAERGSARRPRAGWGAGGVPQLGGNFGGARGLPSAPTTAPHPSRLNPRSPFFSREKRCHGSPQSALPLRADRRRALSPAARPEDAPGPDSIPPPPPPLRFCLLQVRNLLNVNLKAVTDALPTAATARSTCMCTPRTSPISAKCATSPTRTRAPCAST